jgi:V-type H+-transporting ATPase subunit a
MGSWWRSRDMKYVSLILSEDAAHECVHNLGELSALQFIDLNPEQTAFQRRYVNYVKRCDELERKLRFILKEIEAFGLQIS